MTIINFIHKKSTAKIKTITSVVFCFWTLFTFSQVTSEIDTTTIRIGEQISFKINVVSDSTKLVVFPEGQTFSPLETVEAFKIDTLKEKGNYKLSRIYKLTQFDSGKFTLPRQKILIDKKTYYTDSLLVDVKTIVVDTTKQKLFDIKPILEVEKPKSTWWIWLLLVVAILAVLAFVLYWFVWRTKPLTKEEEIALLPPYDRAKLAIKELDENEYIIQEDFKGYYSELTLIVRKYLEEKVYDKALESTTNELISRLELLKEANQLPISKETLSNLQTILQRADLVKFAKSLPDVGLLELDKSTINKEVDNIKSSLPEPTEEEKLLDAKYKEEQERKKKQRKIYISIAASVLTLILTYIGFGVYFGFKTVNDTITRNQSKLLLESDWVKSEYGFPPIWIETPQVLERKAIDSAKVSKENLESEFFYTSKDSLHRIRIISKFIKQPSNQNPQAQQNATDTPEIDLLAISEARLKDFENRGKTDISVKRDKFTTPNGAEGLKTYGTCNLLFDGGDKKVNAEYAIFGFSDSKNIVQQIVLVWPSNDEYATQISEQIINSIELKPDPEKEEEKR